MCVCSGWSKYIEILALLCAGIKSVHSYTQPFLFFSFSDRSHCILQAGLKLQPSSLSLNLLWANSGGLEATPGWVIFILVLRSHMNLPWTSIPVIPSAQVIPHSPVWSNLTPEEWASVGREDWERGVEVRAGPVDSIHLITEMIWGKFLPLCVLWF